MSANIKVRYNKWVGIFTGESVGDEFKFLKVQFTFDSGKTKFYWIGEWHLQPV
jgi:hypothetical protein